MKPWVKETLALVLSIIVAEGAGIIGAFYSSNSVQTWYSTLHKPSFSPPNWLFGPVWTVLYILMGTAAYLVWRRLGAKNDTHRKEAREAIQLYVSQLCINTSWSIIFFGGQDIRLALLTIGIMLMLIVATMFAFLRVSKAAFWLMVPYICWVLFATILNYSLLVLN